MCVSVAITTYNGSKYIEELLYSIYCQDRKPDEVVIADDCSTDNTYSIVQKFIHEKGLEKTWTVYQNNKNYGFVDNFFSCIKRTNGKIIFMCDQDDIWLNNKISSMAEILENNNQIKALICKEKRIDEQGKVAQKPVKETGKISQISFDKEVRTCLGAGHLLALKRELFNDYVEDVKNAGLTFDVPFCLIAAAQGALYQIDSNLVKRRIHSNNTSGISKNKYGVLSDKNRYIEGRKCRLAYFQYIIKNLESSISKEDKKKLKVAIEILQYSVYGLEHKKLLPLLRELLCRNQFINKKVSLANLYMCYK